MSRWVKLVLCAVALCGAATAATPPCTAASAECTQWITVGSGPGRILVYRTFPLDVRNEAVRRAVVMVYGAGRDADNYFRHLLAAAFLAGALENTLLAAPRFASNDGRECRDALGAEELNWPCEGPHTWRSGAFATGSQIVTSYDAADAILLQLANREIFPQLGEIVLAGHSAGGQFVTRYQMSNSVHERLGVPVRYVISNPSSYAYLDPLRPTAGALPANVAAAPPGYQPPPAKALLPFAEYPDARNCTSYDDWPYGLKNREGYSARRTDDELKKQLAARPATYLLAELDILPLSGFDTSCPAMAQGATRLARGLAYAKYVNESYKAKHETVIVPACGHNARCMFTSEAALPVLFPKE